MKRREIWVFIIAAALISFSTCTTRPEKETPAEKAPVPSEALRLTVCYPSTGSLRALINLKTLEVFNPGDWHVVGVYHEKERTDYQQSRDMVREQGLEWITFEEIAGDLTKDNLFTQNQVSPHYRRIFEQSDGIIFFGGADIPPYLYGEKTHLLTSIRTPFRHFFELSFVFHLLGGHQDPAYTPYLEEAPEFPILGICLGEQTLNVGTGGTMIQDIWSEVYGLYFLEDIAQMDSDNWHANPLARLYPQFSLFPYHLHPIQLNPEAFFVTHLGFNAGDTPLILSSHHQAADKLGKGLVSAASTLDGKITEAVWHTGYPHVLGIQFHPEFPLLWNEEASFRMTPEDETVFTPFQKLKDHPPSLEFHQKIWSWLEEKVQKYHQSREKKFSTS